HAWVDELEDRIAESRRQPRKDEPAKADDFDADRPLAPGSGAPSLASRIAAVTGRADADENAPPSDRSRADYIAAARRAAQAAAVEEADDEVKAGKPPRKAAKAEKARADKAEKAEKAARAAE